MVLAKLIKEDDDGYIVEVKREDYEYYMKELSQWLEENQEKVIRKPNEKCIKEFIME